MKVGASRYQDPEFKKAYPDFSSISRFGIGVLSTFMIADHVELITCHPDDEKARVLNLRSVHGKYLIQLADKFSDAIPEQIRSYGTRVRLQVRPSAELPDVMQMARHWIVIPDCDVTVSVDQEDDPVAIGYTSPEEALYHALERADFVRWDDRQQVDDEDAKYKTKVRVEQVQMNGLTVAFALRWSQYFKEWSFLSGAQIHKPDATWLLGTCVEGIRVELDPPGYQDANGVAAIANARGQSAPKTNVARSGLEQTPEFDEMISSVYSAYCGHVKTELSKMQTEREFSLTWSVQEARYLLRSLLNAAPRSSKLLSESIYDLPLILVETKEGRQAVSIRDLQTQHEFWTIDGQFFRSAERMIREVSSSASLGSVIKALEVDALALPEGTIVCDTSVQIYPYSAAFDKKEVDKVRIDRQQRRLDLRWSNCGEEHRWAVLPRSIRDKIGHPEVEMLVAHGELEVEGKTDESAVRCFGRTFVLPGSRVATYLLNHLQKAVHGKDEGSAYFACILFNLVHQRFSGKRRKWESEDDLRAAIEGNRGERRELLQGVDFRELAELFNRESFTIFDSAVWARKEGEI